MLLLSCTKNSGEKLTINECWELMPERYNRYSDTLREGDYDAQEFIQCAFSSISNRLLKNSDLLTLELVKKDSNLLPKYDTLVVPTSQSKAWLNISNWTFESINLDGFEIYEGRIETTFQGEYLLGDTTYYYQISFISVDPLIEQWWKDPPGYKEGMRDWIELKPTAFELARSTPFWHVGIRPNGKDDLSGPFFGSKADSIFLELKSRFEFDPFERHDRELYTPLIDFLKLSKSQYNSEEEWGDVRDRYDSLLFEVDWQSKRIVIDMIHQGVPYMGWLRIGKQLDGKNAEFIVAFEIENQQYFIPITIFPVELFYDILRKSRNLNNPMGKVGMLDSLDLRNAIGLKKSA